MKATVYWIEAPWPGRLAILLRPRGGDWLEDEVKSWRSEGIDMVISALTTNEEAELDIEREAALCQENSISFMSFPIEDRGLPASTALTGEFVRQVESELVKGRAVAIHCRQGVGRSALLAACLLVVSGVDTEMAFGRIKAARGSPVPDTLEQQQWVVRFVRDYLATVPGN